MSISTIKKAVSTGKIYGNCNNDSLESENSQSCNQFFGNKFHKVCIMSSLNILPKLSGKNFPKHEPTKAEICIFKTKDFFLNKEILKDKMTKCKSKKFINIIISDDENLTRKSNLRLITKVANENNYNINIIQVNDGVECLYIVYKCVKSGIKISLIFSDETMNFMNGLKCAEILGHIAYDNKQIKIPFYLVTAFENMSHCGKTYGKDVTEILAKPLTREIAEKVLCQYC